MSEAEVITMIMSFYGIIIGAGCLFSLLVQALICYLLLSVYQAVPEQYQRVSPGSIWLLMIPCFNIIWHFFVIPKISESYRDYVEARGVQGVTDTHVGIAWAYSISVVCCIVPCINNLAWMVALVLLIIYLVMMFDLKKRLEMAG